MAMDRGFGLGRTADWGLEFERWVAQSTVSSAGAVAEWYPFEVGGLPAEPSLEERVDSWLRRHEEAMNRLADL